MNNQISAEIIADSINTHGNRITSFVLVIPRIVLAEFNTHRAVSRNSASSRAIPFSKMLEMVKTNPFIPMRFQKDHSGMQGTEYFGEAETKGLESSWLLARDYAVKSAESLSKDNVTKQLCNRLLEPFMYHKIIATATEWENFIALRAHDAAEIHIADVAYKMLEAMNASEPIQLMPGEWHIPFGDRIDTERLISLYESLYKPNSIPQNRLKSLNTLRIKIATARCARVSYNNFEGKDDYEADIKLHDNLLSMGHMSPMEHCAQAMDSDKLNIIIESNGNMIRLDDQSGNFKGFTQYRTTLPGENKSEPRLNK